MSEHNHVENRHPKPDSGYSTTTGQQKQTKYTFLNDIKILQDRLQDMYTNRSDLVNVTGDGLAAAHTNEVREIFWIYIKSLGWIAGLHGALLGMLILLFFGIVGFIVWEVGGRGSALAIVALATLPFVGSMGYMIYASKITEESRKWVVGENTRQFFIEMKKAMSFIETNILWMIFSVMFFAVLFMGFLDQYLIKASRVVLKVAYGAILPDNIVVAALSNAQIDIVLYIVAISAILFSAKTYVVLFVGERAAKIQAEHKLSVDNYREKDTVQIARKLFQGD